MPVGITALDWDVATETLTIKRAHAADLTFLASDIPQNVNRTVNALGAWCDNNLQTFLVNKYGFTTFIRAKVRSVSPTLNFEFVVGDDAAVVAAYVFGTGMLPP